MHLRNGGELRMAHGAGLGGAMEWWGNDLPVKISGISVTCTVKVSSLKVRARRGGA